MRRLPLFLSLLAFVADASAAAPALLPGVQGNEDSRLQIEARFVPATAKPGDEVVLEVQIAIEAGYHVYGSKDTTAPTRLVLTQAGGLEARGDAEVPPGQEHTAYGLTNYWLLGAATLKQRLRVPADAQNGALRLLGRVDYVACTEQFCDPPGKDDFSATLQIEGGAADGKAAANAPGAGAPDVPGIPGVQGVGEPRRLTMEPRFVPATAKPGDEVVLEVAIAVVSGYHVYGSKDTTGPTRLLLTEPRGLEAIGDAEVPPGVKHTEHGQTSYWLSGSAVLKQRLRVPANARDGALRIAGLVDYVPCTETFCERPAKDKFTAALQIEGGVDGPLVEDPPDGAVGPGTGAVEPSPRNGSANAPAVRQPKYSIGDAGDGSLWQLILLCIAGGLIALVMPCTYPMIPITFSFFTKQAEARGGKVLPLALAYGGGIIGIFVLIGIAVGEVITKFAAHWATNLVIGVAFVVFGLSLFGFILLQPPQFVARIAGRAGRSGGLVGVFLMGATLVVSSFTCTAPIVGSLLASVATEGSGRTALGMAVFGLTMALPFVFLALLPGRVRQLPRSGEWMNTLKVSLGFIELAAALKFLSNVDVALVLGWCPREGFLVAWAFLFTLLALYLFGLMGHREVPVAGVSRVRNGSGMLSLAFAFYCLFGAMGFPLDPVMTAFEPPYRLRAQDEHPIVVDDYPAALELARRENRWLLVNFSGFTCVNCRVAEGSVFPDKDVAPQLRERFVESRLHLDVPARIEPGLYEVHQRLQAELIGSVAVPHYAILDPHDGSFLFRTFFRTGTPAGLRQDFLDIFAALPERPSAK